jgi:hypothetical protein
MKMINGSANLTKTGLGVKGTQWNHIWIVELKGDYEDDEDYQTEMEHYETYRSKTTEFFGEFGDAFEQIEPERKLRLSKIGLLRVMSTASQKTLRSKR